MKSINSIFAIILFFPIFSFAGYKNLDDVLAKATKEEMSDLPKLLKQIRLVPAENSMMRVTEIDKGSVYEREGIKVGDLITTNQSQSGQKKMAVKRSLRSVPQKSSND